MDSDKDRLAGGGAADAAKAARPIIYEHNGVTVDRDAYIHILEEQVKRLRADVKYLESETTVSEDGVTDAPTPKITYVPPGQWRRVKKVAGLVANAGTLLVSGMESANENDMRHCGRHDRLAINSSLLLGLVSDVVGEPLSDNQNVWVWPYKYLVVCEPQIRTKLRKLEQECTDQAATDETCVRENGENKQAQERQQQQDSDKSARKSRPSEAMVRRRLCEELRLVVEFMDSQMSGIFSLRRQIEDLSLKKISFGFLWHLYKPGDMLINKAGKENQDKLQAFVVLHVTGGRAARDRSRRSGPAGDWDSDSETEQKNLTLARSIGRMTPLILDCAYIDSDGDLVGPRPRRFVFPEYPGEVDIVSLDAYPLAFDNEKDRLLGHLTKRGKRFLSVVDGAHLHYRGTSLREFQGQKGNRFREYFEISPEDVDSEVMVDQAAAIDHYKQTGTFKFALGGGVVARPTPANDSEVADYLPQRGYGDYRESDIFDDSAIDVDRRAQFVAETDMLRTVSVKNLRQLKLRDDYYALMPPRVYGYAMLNRKWLPLKIDSLRNLDEVNGEPGFRKTRFEDLVLPRGHKKLLQALIKQHTSAGDETVHLSKEFSMDIVYRKGKGLVILLHGPPGVGKTSTAECVAAELGRPLLPITCGDLGGDSREMEKSLEKFCRLAEKWRCVMLLDEADVFLGKREKGDILRNSYVAVFLRVLEYYPGVLLLTSNRVGELDEAFRSRIHVCLFYPKLDIDSSRRIWHKNLARIRSSAVDMEMREDEITQFYERQWHENQKSQRLRIWNGRDIRNAFQTALALAQYEFFEARRDPDIDMPRPVLRADHFERVGSTSAFFDEYISNMHGIDGDDPYSVMAERESVRKDTMPNFAFSRQPSWKLKADTRAKRSANQRRIDALLESSQSEDEDNDADSNLEEELERLKLEIKMKKLKKKAKDRNAPGS
ncbi:hypothetical protein RB595_004242 [Gaeumannomyces hyphopodioides]